MVEALSQYTQRQKSTFADRFGLDEPTRRPAINHLRDVSASTLSGCRNGKTLELKDRQELPMGPEADGLYQVVSGMLQCGVISEDGRRWISGFILPREVMLFEHGEIQSEIAQALCPTTLIKIPRSVFVNPSCMDPHLYAMITSSLLRTHNVALRFGLMLGRANAAERLAFFLLDLMKRLGGRSNARLLMSRADIGDHLGLTSETVTRTFTLLQRHNYARVSGRDVEILNPTALEHLAAAILTA